MQSQLAKISASGPILEIWEHDGADPILFYPGTMLAPRHYELLIECLHKRGFTVASPHFSGHGHLRRRRGFTFQTLLSEGLAAENWLRENCGERMAICGHSQGGILTLAHAASSTGLSGAFPISAVFPQYPEAIWLTRFGKMETRREKIIAFMRRLAAFLPELPIFLPVYLQMGRILRARREPLIMGKANGRWSYPLRYMLSLFEAVVPEKMHCPICLFNAQDDALFRPELIMRVFERIDAPKKTLTWLANGGHMAPFNVHQAGFIAGSIAQTCSASGMKIRQD